MNGAWQRLSAGKAVDTALAVVVALLIAWAIVDPPGPSSWWPAWSAWPVAAVLGFPIALRRHRPLPMLGAAAGAAVLATTAGAVAAGAIWLSFVPAALALYQVAATTTTGRSAASLAACVTGATAAVQVFYAQVLPGLPAAPAPSELPPFWPVEIGAICVFMGAGWAAGAVVRWKRETSARLARHLAEAAVADERRRIARELHDVIGHSMGLIAVKATVANHVAETHPQEARAALAVIEQTSQSALTEIRRMLGLLRADGDPHDDLTPAPGLTDLPELASHARSAGVDVDLVVREEAALPPAVALSVYRIVQEALTNVITHAGPTRCSVQIDIDERHATIEVLDDGPRHRREPSSARHGGHGLIGMRERTAMYGGTLTAGPRPEGGFRITAHLAYGGPA
ncbi:sensor histidine kinase [Nonomuraea aridisoli]|uniref:histidine kinase n=1 Tax=Nonomuraea aridisoli TaxID=2070368 RepID=A0A2W2DGF7_9ACTN|nr:sensor histidine kinase [Nonomuraea aridisoli]PZG04255.1 two-component sensor histidine kinase [Nonomuraea aridisoli]